MNLIKFNHRKDFGDDWYLQILNTGKHMPKPFKNWSLIQASVSWNEYPGWPYIKISSGTGSLISIMFWAYKFGFDIGIIERTWDWGKLDKALEDFDSANGVA